MTILPIAEVFFSNYEDREGIPGPGNSWEGNYPYLDTDESDPDNALSYGMHEDTGFSVAPWIGAQFAPVSIPDVTGMRVTVQVRPVNTWPLALDVLVGSSDLWTALYFGTRAIDGETDPPGQTWTTRTWTVADGEESPGFDLFVAAEFQALAAAGDLMCIVNMGAGGLGTDSFACSLVQIELFGGAPPTPRTIPLRQFHRDDGLGATPPRAFGGASRIRTGRAYGYD